MGEIVDKQSEYKTCPDFGHPDSVNIRALHFMMHTSSKGFTDILQPKHTLIIYWKKYKDSKYNENRKKSQRHTNLV